MRLMRNRMFMAIAHVISQRATCTRAQHGAVIVKDNRIISMGYNGSPSGTPHCFDKGCIIGPEGGCIRTVHAEANAIAHAAKAGIATDEATIFVTGEPCLRCAQLIINAGIKTVWMFGYPEEYRDQRGITLLKESLIDLYYMGRPENLVTINYQRVPEKSG